MDDQAEEPTLAMATGDSFVYSVSDLPEILDDVVVGDDETRWNDFFANPPTACPFLVEDPDENLVEWMEQGLIDVGSALELGCGHGRNSIYLASGGFQVEAVDLSEEAIGQAVERAKSSGVAVGFRQSSIFDESVRRRAYDLVYDSGCFHHLPPHRRKDYVELVDSALRPGGMYGLVCFGPEGGSGYTDRQVYEWQGLGGGLGYTEKRLRALWDRHPFSVRILRRMRKSRDGDQTFGEGFLWTLLARKAPSA